MSRDDSLLLDVQGLDVGFQTATGLRAVVDGVDLGLLFHLA